MFQLFQYQLFQVNSPLPLLCNPSGGSPLQGRSSTAAGVVQTWYLPQEMGIAQKRFPKIYLSNKCIYIYTIHIYIQYIYIFIYPYIMYKCIDVYSYIDLMCHSTYVCWSIVMTAGMQKYQYRWRMCFDMYSVGL